MTVSAEVTPEEAEEISKMAKLMGVPFAVMAGAAIRQGLSKGKSN